MADTNPLDDRPRGQQQGQPQRVEARFGRPLSVVALGMLVDEPVHKPPCVGLPEKAADEQRDAEHQARLHEVEVVKSPEDDRPGGREEDTAEAEAEHVV